MVHKAGDQSVWFVDTETDYRSIRVGGLVGVLDESLEGSQALCGIKEAATVNLL